MRCVWTSLLFASAALWGTSRTQEETRWATVRRYDNGECLGEPSYVSREDDSCHPMPTEAGNANYRSFLVQYDCDRLEERAFFYCTDDDCQDCVKPSWSLSEPGQCHGGESSSWEHVCPDTILAQGPEDHALILHFDNSDCAGRPDRAITEGICTPCPFQGHDRCSGMSHLLVQYDCGDANGQHQVLFCEDASCESCREADAMSLDNVAPNQCSSSSAREASWQIICSNSRVSSTPRVHGETVFFDNEDCTGRVRRLTVDGVCNVLPTSIRENLPPRVNLSSFITYYDCEVDPSVSDEEWADSHYLIACRDDDCRHCSNTSFPVDIPRPGICSSNDGILGIMHLCPDNDTGEVVIPASTQDQGSSSSSSGDSGISVGAFVGGLIGGIMGGLLLGATGMAYAAKRNHALVTRLLAEGESSSPPPSVAMVVPPPPLDQNPGENEDVGQNDPILLPPQAVSQFTNRVRDTHRSQRAYPSGPTQGGGESGHDAFLSGSCSIFEASVSSRDAVPKPRRTDEKPRAEAVHQSAPGRVPGCPSSPNGGACRGRGAPLLPDRGEPVGSWLRTRTSSRSIGRIRKVDPRPLEKGVPLAKSGACLQEGKADEASDQGSLVTRARARVALSSARCSPQANRRRPTQGMAWRILQRAPRREALARANAWAWPRRTDLPAGPSMAVDVFDQPRSMSMQHGLVPLDTTHDGPIGLSEPNFNDVDAAFRGHTLGTLLFSWAILGTTSIRPLVQNCEAVLDFSKKVLGTKTVEFAIKHTMFRHFCVDDNPKALEDAITGLRARGVNSILDYAKEADLSDGSISHGEAMEQTFNEFLRTMDVVKSLDSDGFTAIKVTALARPDFLQKSSQLLNFVYSKFAEEDVDGAGTIPRSAFMRVFKNNFHYGPNMWSSDPLQDVLDLPVGTPVNYRRWCKNLPIVDLKNLQDVADVNFDEGDIAEAQDLQRRMFALGEHAAEKGVRLLVDAEQTYFQRTMDQMAFQMQQKYNRGGTYVYQTYQLYLKNSDKELEWELREASEKGFKLGAKIVRGAYMDSERALAESKGLPSPIHDSKEDTDQNFNRCLDSLLREVGRGTSSVFIASQSQASVEHALERMKEWSIPRGSSDVFFGQLKGMADHLTFTLGKHGYRVAKLVPYGKVSDVMPFLIRRAQENSAILSRSSGERELIMRAFTRRLCSL